GPSSPLIENYLREAGFWHVDNIGRGCKLDPKLISTFVERWRPETHTFYLPCGECTITLEDVQLQLRLPMDESVLTESAQSADWGAICYDLLGKISETIYGGKKSTICSSVHPSDPRRLSNAGQVTKPRTSDVAAKTHRL
ncbi:hypothetical protein Gotur_013905, partial [Gossypium turneri]